MIKRRVSSLRRQDTTCTAGRFDLTHRAQDGEQDRLSASGREGGRRTKVATLSTQSTDLKLGDPASFACPKGEALKRGLGSWGELVVSILDKYSRDSTEICGAVPGPCER